MNVSKLPTKAGSRIEFELKYGPTQRKLSKALETVLECTRQQQETAGKVIENLQQQATEAVQLEKRNQVVKTAKSFGVATNDLEFLKVKLTPILPKMWKEIGIKPEDLELKMESSKRHRMIAAADIISTSREAMRKTPSIPSASYDSSNFRAPLGRYADAPSNAEFRADEYATKAYDLSNLFGKLTAGTFFGSANSRQEISSIYICLRNIKPVLGTVVTNLMFLLEQKDPTGIDTWTKESGTKFADDFILTAMNHPQSKAALCATLKKLLTDSHKQNETAKLLMKGMNNSKSLTNHLGIVLSYQKKSKT